MRVVARQYVRLVFVMRKIRVIFTKTDRMKFVSHLDMNRFIIRLVRMAKIPIWYTEGFNQHPYISFALPLSLGFESIYEIIDFKIVDDNFTNEMILDALNSKSIPGIMFIDAFEEDRKAKEIAYSKYKIKFFDPAIAKKFNEFIINSNQISVLKTTKKGGTKEIEIKQYLKEFDYDKEALTASLLIPAGSELNINPTLYLDSYSNELSLGTDYSILRIGIYDKELNLFK